VAPAGGEFSGRHLSIECVASNPMVSFDSLIHFSGLLDFFLIRHRF
jgi:hypothetical protein